MLHETTTSQVDQAGPEVDTERDHYMAPVGGPRHDILCQLPVGTTHIEEVAIPVDGRDEW
jgi:hypothetical protein